MKQLHMTKNHRPVAVTTLAIGLFLFLSPTGCAPKGESRRNEFRAEELIKHDLAEMQTIDSTGAETINKAYNDRFTKVFGGVSGNHVHTFFAERVKHIYSEKYLVDRGALASNDMMDPRYLAQNLNLGIWMNFIISGRPMDIMIDGKKIVITGPRQGFVITGPGYQETEGEYPVPTQLRQSVLLHEARHSDCTGGLSSANLENFRNGNFKDNQCMHHHVACPKGHYLENEIACDDHPWGAYSVGALYVLSQLLNSNTKYEQEALEAYLIDQRGRLINLDFYDMLLDNKGEPNMSSMGVVP